MRFVKFVKKQKVFASIFILVFIIGIFLRFYQLGSIPSSLNWDEASWGYNAYSILQTGKDEHGNTLPLSFKAFGDYKQPLYVYASVVPIALFDLTPFATRFPSAFFGSLSVLFVYLLTFELFRKEKYARVVALLAMFFFAISPWSLQFSRVAYEANVGLSFIILGSWLFIRGVNLKQHWYLFAGAAALALSAYTYHSDKLFAPALLVVLLAYGWKYFIKKKVLVVLLLVFFFLCNIFWIVDSRTTARGKGVLFTGQQTQLLESSLKQMDHDIKAGDSIGTLVHNRRIVYTQYYIENYLKHFDPNWLYIRGDNPRHHAPQMGLLYFANLGFMLLGMFFLAKQKLKQLLFLLAWLLLAPAASALAVDAPNASRSLIFLPIWHIFEAFGWWYAFSLVKSRKLRLMFIIPALLLMCNVIYYLHQYYAHTSTNDQKSWMYGYKEAVLETDNLNKRVIFSQNFEQPYIFYLYYTKYDPAKYISSGGSNRIYDKCFNIDNKFFGFCEEGLKKGDIYVVEGQYDTKGGAELKRFDYANGEPAVRIFDY
jgi:4-amino-4-deoxy-L-arabinose transferase-like glycosyltransferase